jgi:hypothetical protein
MGEYVPQGYPLWAVWKDAAVDDPDAYRIGRVVAWTPIPEGGGTGRFLDQLSPMVTVGRGVAWPLWREPDNGSGGQLDVELFESKSEASTFVLKEQRERQYRRARGV